MPVKKVEKIWMNGKLVNWDDAKVHVLSHVIHYGSSWFEGIRCYDTAKGPAIFRLDEHLKRLENSAKIYRVDAPYTITQLKQAAMETIRANKMKACYIRPIFFRGYGDVGVNPSNNPVDTVIAVWEWGQYLGHEAVQDGIDVCVSSWRRAAPDTFPTLAKTGGNYMNSQLIKLEAMANGYTEGVALDADGYVSEGSGENIFVVRDGILYTTPLHSAILGGITRASVIQLAKESGIEVREEQMLREFLYIADEVFFSGTAAELTPIRSVDKIKVGNGKPGQVTRELQNKFFNIIRNGEDTHGWLTFVYD
ncbi:MAG TPA: branched-chain amino acid transaminase [Candidatus Acidoferrales bacterium]|nr:branched-chain amino acid transaminase [Candidatus Acidoferrales bacterium]